jgi:hypothetical protein
LQPGRTRAPPSLTLLLRRRRQAAARRSELRRRAAPAGAGQSSESGDGSVRVGHAEQRREQRRREGRHPPLHAHLCTSVRLSLSLQRLTRSHSRPTCARSRHTHASMPCRRGPAYPAGPYSFDTRPSPAYPAGPAGIPAGPTCIPAGQPVHRIHWCIQTSHSRVMGARHTSQGPPRPQRPAGLCSGRRHTTGDG